MNEQIYNTILLNISKKIEKKSWGSTDMGNVTYVKPSFHNVRKI